MYTCVDCINLLVRLTVWDPRAYLLDTGYCMFAIAIEMILGGEY